MSALVEWLAMDGHGPYVWSAYLITLVILLLNVVQPALAKHNLVRTAARRLRREGL